MQPFLGQITLLPYNFAPMDWAPCQGQLMSINENQALFSLIGTSFGGDGETNFALADLRGKEPTPSTQYCIALAGVYPSRN